MIKACSDDPLVGTEAPTTGDEADLKATTTVGMEFGTLRAEDDGFAVELNLYGVPGQERFSFMWDIVSAGMDGFFLIVDASRPETWETSATIGRYFGKLSDCPVVVGVNRAATPDVINDVYRTVAIPGANYLVFDVTDPIDARNSLMELLLLILDRELGTTQLREAS